MFGGRPDLPGVPEAAGMAAAVAILSGDSRLICMLVSYGLCGGAVAWPDPSGKGWFLYKGHTPVAGGEREVLWREMTTMGDALEGYRQHENRVTQADRWVISCPTPWRRAGDAR